MLLTVKVLRKGYSKRMILRHVTSAVEVEPGIFDFTDYKGKTTRVFMKLCDECLGYVE